MDATEDDFTRPPIMKPIPPRPYGRALYHRVDNCAGRVSVMIPSRGSVQNDNAHKPVTMPDDRHITESRRGG